MSIRIIEVGSIRQNNGNMGLLGVLRGRFLGIFTVQSFVPAAALIFHICANRCYQPRPVCSKSNYQTSRFGIRIAPTNAEVATSGIPSSFTLLGSFPRTGSLL